MSAWILVIRYFLQSVGFTNKIAQRLKMSTPEDADFWILTRPIRSGLHLPPTTRSKPPAIGRFPLRLPLRSLQAYRLAAPLSGSLYADASGEATSRPANAGRPARGRPRTMGPPPRARLQMRL